MNESVNVVNERPPTFVFELQVFLLDRQVRNLAKKTIEWYTHSLDVWRVQMVACASVSETIQVAPGYMRRFLLLVEV
jgi:hypothetical protein